MYYATSDTTDYGAEPVVILELSQPDDTEEDDIEDDDNNRNRTATAKAGEDENESEMNESENSDSNQDKTLEWTTVIRSGLTVRPTMRYIEEIGTTAAEVNYFATLLDLDEFGLVGVGIGGGFNHTSELHVMK